MSISWRRPEQTSAVYVRTWGVLMPLSSDSPVELSVRESGKRVSGVRRFDNGQMVNGARWQVVGSCKRV